MFREKRLFNLLEYKLRDTTSPNNIITMETPAILPKKKIRENTFK